MIVELLQFFIYSRYKLFIRHVVCRYFLLSFRLSLLHGILPDVKVSNFGEVQFIFLLSLVLLVLYLKRLCLTQGHEDLCLVFLQEFIVFSLTFWSLIHLELIFVSDLSYKGPHLFFCMCTESYPYTTCWKDNSFSSIILVLWLKIQFTIKVFIYVLYTYMSVLMTVLQSLDYCSFEVSF